MAPSHGSLTHQSQQLTGDVSKRSDATVTDWLAGDVAVVTGGSSGNGREICLTLAEHGADIVVPDIQETPREGGEPTHELILRMPHCP